MLLEVSRSKLVPLIGFDWKDEDALALEWLAKLGNPYEMVLVDREGRTAIDWGVYGAPETFLVNAAGIVSYKHVGPLTEEVSTRNSSRGCEAAWRRSPDAPARLCFGGVLVSLIALAVDPTVLPDPALQARSPR